MLLFFPHSIMASFQDFRDKALPGLIAFSVAMIWNDIREMRSDIKVLLEQSATHKARLDNLERAIFKNAAVYGEPFPPSDHNHKPLRYEMVAVLRDENLTPQNNETSNRRTKRKLLEHI